MIFLLQFFGPKFANNLKLYATYINAKLSMYVDFGVENYNKDPKFQVGNHVRISNYKNIFAKDYQIALKKSFQLRKLKGVKPK